MARNTETLSTRDLASPTEMANDAKREGDPRNAAAPEGQPGVYDQTAPAEEETRLSANEPTTAAAAEQTRPGVGEQTAPRAEVPTGVSASAHDETIGANRRDDRLGVETGVPGDEDRPTESPEAVPTQDQDTQAAARSMGDAGGVSNASGSLLPADMDDTFQQRWKEIQTRFVDEPRGAVEDADGLVARLMQQLADGFAQERERLEAQWGRGEDISTEDLRVALQRYRTFFQRLLST
jgi:hypothetical protein